MKEIRVLGTGCANCKTTLKLIKEIAQQRNTAIDLQKIEDIEEIMKFRILATPGVVVDGVLVHSGGVPKRELIETWL